MAPRGSRVHLADIVNGTTYSPRRSTTWSRAMQHMMRVFEARGTAEGVRRARRGGRSSGASSILPATCCAATREMLDGPRGSQPCRAGRAAHAFDVAAMMVDEPLGEIRAFMSE